MFSDGVERPVEHSGTPFHSFLRGHSLRVWDGRIEALKWENFRLREKLKPKVKTAGAS